MNRFCLWLLTWLGLTAKPDFTAELAEINPAHEDVPAGRLIVVGGPGYQKWAYFRCPCGCGEVIMLSLASSKRPRWDGKIGLATPPKHRTVGEADGGVL